MGDCSLRISAARADLDAGEWECQVCRFIILSCFVRARWLGALSPA